MTNQKLVNPISKVWIVYEFNNSGSIMTAKRMCVYPKDVQRITGYSERFGRKLLIKIKKSLNKEPHHFISIVEFCTYTGLNKDEVSQYLID